MPPAAASLQILVVEPEGFDAFVAYLNDHLRDNGADGSYFQPMSRVESRLPPEREAAWRAGLGIPVGTPGWRRLWIARDAGDGSIAGHIDLRSHAQSFCGHRCLLGMGVDRGQRHSGLGARLVVHAENWARETGALDWIDLQVLSDNGPALRLYERCGFQRTGETADLFRIDGASLASTSMTKRVAGYTSCT